MFISPWPGEFVRHNSLAGHRKAKQECLAAPSESFPTCSFYLCGTTCTHAVSMPKATGLVKRMLLMRCIKWGTVSRVSCFRRIEYALEAAHARRADIGIRCRVLVVR
jgi:hypothetical protein